jgi:hypothetical protein
LGIVGVKTPLLAANYANKQFRSETFWQRSPMPEARPSLSEKNLQELPAFAKRQTRRIRVLETHHVSAKAENLAISSGRIVRFEEEESRSIGSDGGGEEEASIGSPVVDPGGMWPVQ